MWVIVAQKVLNVTIKVAGTASSEAKGLADNDPEANELTKGRL